MRRVFLIVFLVGLAAALLGMLGLGAFPPRARPVAVEHEIPLDKLPPSR